VISKLSDGTSTSVRVVFSVPWPHNLWHQHDSVTVNDKPVTVTPPVQEAPEDYVVRHEIIALHLAVTVGSAEPYPSCTKSSLAFPRRGYSTKPSPYNDNDRGSYDPSIYSIFPEPPTFSRPAHVEPSIACGHDSGQLSRRRRHEGPHRDHPQCPNVGRQFEGRVPWRY